MAATDEFGRHEVMHTAHVISSMFDEHILGHPATEANEAVKASAERASEALAELYQVCGREFA